MDCFLTSTFSSPFKDRSFIVIMQWSCCRPLLEILMRNILLRVSMTKNTIEDFITGELSMNYNNIQKVSNCLSMCTSYKNLGT